MPPARYSSEGHCCLWGVLVWMLFLSGASTAETLDQVVNPKAARNKWVSDMAGVVDPDTEHRLNSFIDHLEQKTTAEMAVVTIRRTDGRTPKEFATELFNRWDIGKKGKDNGVLILLVMEARSIEVETGYGVEDVLPDGKLGEILDTEVIPRFKQGDFGGGLLAGVQTMAEAIAGEKLALAPQLRSPQIRPSPVVPRAPVAPTGLIPWLLVLGVLLVALFGYIWWRSGVRYCLECGKRMRRLTEERDDAYLSFAQKFEEELGSMNYHVWRCDDCQTCKVERAPGWFRSSYGDCPKCGHRTVRMKSYILREPTYEREGVEKGIGRCRFPKCSYQYTQQFRIPRLERPLVVYGGGFGGGWSSGSWGSGRGGGRLSGGSFGGGSSGGGGAGRSW
jgi:Beta-propeller domains of methanol dehydrogenase type